MSDKYTVFGPQINYNGTYGKANQEAIYDPFASRFHTNIIDDNQNEIMRLINGHAGNSLRSLQLSSREVRDISIDTANPKEALPVDVQSLLQAEIVPNFEPVMRDLLLPSDYKQMNQVGLLQQSRMNYLNQAHLFDDSKIFGSELGKKEAGSQGSTQPISANKYWEFSAPSATGAQTYFLDSESNKLGQIENSVAF
jgi:hypothetical protein